MLWRDREVSNSIINSMILRRIMLVSKFVHAFSHVRYIISCHFNTYLVMQQSAKRCDHRQSKQVGQVSSVSAVECYNMILVIEAKRT